MALSEELKWRGFINQTTLGDLAELDKKKWIFYHGWDASADSLQVGNLAAAMLDKLFIRHGHKAIILAGGATSMIGDPGGKDAERALQSEETVRNNVRKVSTQLEKLFGQKVHFVNNMDWFKKMDVMEFLRDVGKHFSMTPLVQRDYIANRMGEGGSGISYAEFSYTLLQGYDFLHLYQKYGVELQLAGSDQWGNSLSGVELVRRVEGKEVHVLTMPLLINKATGKKFGKSEEGAVWLDPAKTSPNDFYQFWVNVDDEGVGGYLKILTELGKEKIAEVMTAFESDKPGRLAQKTLAYEVTKLVHGKEAAEAAKEYAQTLKSGEISGGRTLAVKLGSEIVSALVESGLTSSKSEARQLMAGGGIYVNDKQTSKTNFEKSDFENGRLTLRRGKTLQNSVLVTLK